MPKPRRSRGAGMLNTWRDCVAALRLAMPPTPQPMANGALAMLDHPIRLQHITAGFQPTRDGDLDTAGLITNNLPRCRRGPQQVRAERLLGDQVCTPHVARVSNPCGSPVKNRCHRPVVHRLKTGAIGGLGGERAMPQRLVAGPVI